jgi:wyosine [tRNA(Phe)-imidazoG37] synthetase (radical SAM superfamily)
MGKYVYGPVPSRRLGRSLGVDLVPLKTCNYDCIYCQLGPTRQTTLTRADYSPVDEVLAEVEARLAEVSAPDWITLGGSGEPTLHASFGRLAERIRAMTDVPICLLTNGGLLSDPEVRADCAALDMVAPNLDAGDEATFQRINRPHPGVTLEGVVAGLEALRRGFAGQIWLEVFLAAGINSSDADIERLKALIDRIRPDRVQLNTAVRPPAEAFVRPVLPQRLEAIRAMLGECAEVIADVDALRQAPAAAATEQEVLAMLRRRPCTVADIATGLAIGRDEAIEFVRVLLEAGHIAEQRQGERVFYHAP